MLVSWDMAQELLTHVLALFAGVLASWATLKKSSVESRQQKTDNAEMVFSAYERLIEPLQTQVDRLSDRVEEQAGYIRILEDTNRAQYEMIWELRILLAQAGIDYMEHIDKQPVEPNKKAGEQVKVTRPPA